jgi:hypothetical protein
MTNTQLKIYTPPIQFQIHIKKLNVVQNSSNTIYIYIYIYRHMGRDQFTVGYFNNLDNKLLNKYKKFLKKF